MEKLRILYKDKDEDYSFPLLLKCYVTLKD